MIAMTSQLKDVLFSLTLAQRLERLLRDDRGNPLALWGGVFADGGLRYSNL
jgi:hypothetical protein